METSNQDHRVNPSYKVTTVRKMLEEDAVGMRKVIYLRCLRIVVHTADTTTFSYTKKGKEKTKNKLGSHRLFLCMDLNSSDGQTVYLIHTKYSDNKNLFSKMIEKRDDGSITIGSLFAILTPHAIVSRYSNDVPMLTCNGGMILCNTPHNLRIVPIANIIPSNITMAFSFYGKIEVT